MDAVKKHEIPQDVANRDRLTVDESNRSIEIVRLQFLYSGKGIAVYALKTRTELLDFSRTLDAWRSRLSREAPVLDSETSERLDFGEMPGQLAEGSAFRIGTKVVTVDRQRFE